MKKMKCDQCEMALSGETFEDWFRASHAHYSSHHPEIMKQMMETGTKEDGAKWMEEARNRWNAIKPVAAPTKVAAQTGAVRKSHAKPKKTRPKKKASGQSKAKTKSKSISKLKSQAKVKPKAKTKKK